MIQILPADRVGTDEELFQLEEPAYVKAWKIMIS